MEPQGRAPDLSDILSAMGSASVGDAGLELQDVDHRCERMVRNFYTAV